MLPVFAVTITIKSPTLEAKEPTADLVPLAVVNTDPIRVMLGEAKFYALKAVYVNGEQLTVSPVFTVKPPVMFMSDKEAATAHWITIVLLEV